MSYRKEGNDIVLVTKVRKNIISGKMTRIANELNNARRQVFLWQDTVNTLEVQLNELREITKEVKVNE
jgi:hypothetical protein